MNRSDLKMYTPERWYFNQYRDGLLVMSNGFPTKALAKSFEKRVMDVVREKIEDGCEMAPGMTHAVEEAKGWEVNDKRFSNYHEALWYKWNNEPATIKGVFQ